MVPLRRLGTCSVNVIRHVSAQISLALIMFTVSALRLYAEVDVNDGFHLSVSITLGASISYMKIPEVLSER
jgi:hypothetical protein